MNIEIIGGTGEGIPRLRTKLFSVDYALRNRRTGEMGIPLRSVIEMSGKEHVGKSTTSRFLAASVNPTGHILIMNVDEAVPDPEYDAHIASLAGFEGTLEYIEHFEKGNLRAHEDMLQEMLERLRDGEVSVCILDSVGSFQAIEEMKGDMGEGYAEAKRARTMGESARWAMSALRQSEDPGLFIYVNHERDTMGGRGTHTLGGQGLKDRAAVRMNMWRKTHRMTSDKKQILGFEVEGRILKNRYGGKGDYYNLYFLEGKGLHPGMTAILDGEKFGIVEFSTTVKLHGESMGYINATFLEAALAGDDEPFEPFFKALEELEANDDFQI